VANVYNLDEAMHDQAKGIVYQVDVLYDIDADEMTTSVKQRKDVESDEFQLRVAHNIESVFRRMVPTYETEMTLIEALAKVTDDV
jgi:5,10-methylene-tetrahydrofolate dehydrogenase/methenyl tetrahydrofolate cyclohydrolase